MNALQRYRASEKGRANHAAYQREWAASHPERKRQLDHETYVRHREKRLKQVRARTYGVTVEFLESKLAEQNNRCGCCGNELEPRRSTCLDHDHKTNAIRDFVCNACNLIIGFADDDVERLEKAIAYLQRFR